MMLVVARDGQTGAGGNVNIPAKYFLRNRQKYSADEWYQPSYFYQLTN